MKEGLERVRELGISFLIAALIPVLASWLRNGGPATCALDGQSLQPIFQVRIQDIGGETQSFCCIRCAQIWLERRNKVPVAVMVTDERSGREIDLSEAHFVRSSVVTSPSTGNRLHVFLHESDAAIHAARFRGKVLSGLEQPFHRPEVSNQTVPHGSDVRRKDQTHG